MKKVTIWKFTATLAFLCTLGACSNSSSPDDEDDYGTSTKPTSATSTKSSAKSNTKSSASNANLAACEALKEVLAAPSNFNIEKDADSDTSWTLSWDYTRNDNRPEEGFEIQVLDMDTESPEWEYEGSSNADVSIYRLKGEKKAGKYYRVVAVDKCAKSKESNRMQIKSNGYGDNDVGKEKTDVPTDVAIARIAPSVWELSWKYADTKDDPNRKFVIQTSKLKDFKWTGLKKPLDGNVRHYYIEGRDMIETYFRLAVVNSGDTSAFTEAVQLTPEIAYRDYMALEVPVPTPKITLEYTEAYDRDGDPETKEKTYLTAAATYTITDKFISKYIVESEYTDTVYYEARWFTSLEHYNYYKGSCEGKKKSEVVTGKVECDSCYWVETIPYQEPSISKRFNVFQDFADAARKNHVYDDCYSRAEDSAELADCLESHVRGVCGYYVQLRIVWKDNVNGKGKGATDWSEWTQPFNVGDISGSDVLCSK